MLDSFFNQIGATLTLQSAMLMFFSALILGVVISLVYMATHKKTGYSQSFVLVNIMLPAIISIIIMLVGNNIARAFSLAGAFSLVRYRSTPGEPKDLTYVLLGLGIGLACGIGFIGYAFVFTVIISIVLLILEKMNFGAPKKLTMQLKIVVPEDMNYVGAFDDILEKYTSYSKLVKVKTSGYGTMYELVYHIRATEDIEQKELIDMIRSRNGNLNVYLNMAPNSQNEW